MDNVELLPGAELGARLRKAGERRVRFKLTFEEIPPPVYEQVNDQEVAVGPKQPVKPDQIKRVPSTLKKNQYKCVDPRGLEGKLSINAGRVVFAPANGVAEGYWAVSLGDVSHTGVEIIEKEKFSLTFHIQDKKSVTFTNLNVQQNAFKALVSNAEVLGNVIVLDQLIATPQSDPETLLTGLDAAELRKSPTGEILPNKTPFKVFASRKTRRFAVGSFNLDLSYITRKCIVMAFPGRQSGVSWNRASEVRRFLSTRHEHSYMVYNLNADPAYHYNSSRFEGRVRRFAIEENAPPTLSVLLELMRDMGAFVRQSPKNVVALHCTGGKQRSGLVACAWLLHSRLFPTAKDAVAYFTAQRMRKGKQALVLPSHLRYLQYVETVGVSGTPAPNTLTFRSVELAPIPNIKGVLVVSVINGSKSWDVKVAGMGNEPVVAFEQPIVVSDEVRLELKIEGGPMLCRVFFHTRFVRRSPVTFEHSDLDPGRAFSQLSPSTTLTLHVAIQGVDRPAQKRGSLTLSKEEEEWLQQQLAAQGPKPKAEEEQQQVAQDPDEGANEEAKEKGGEVERLAQPNAQVEGEERRVSIRALPGEDAKPRPVQRKPTGWVNRRSKDQRDSKGQEEEEGKEEGEGEEEKEEAEEEGEGELGEVEGTINEENAPPGC